MSDLLWQPTEAFIKSSKMYAYMHWLKSQGYGEFKTYDELYAWSVKDVRNFWKSVSEYGDLHFAQKATSVLSAETMPGAKWFEGAKLNFAENILKYFKNHPEALAIVALDESGQKKEYTGGALMDAVASVAAYLAKQGVAKGDRVAGYVGNTFETLVAMLATTSLGGVWSSCSPDFGAKGAIDRFGQIAPKVLFAVTRHAYNGKVHDGVPKLQEIVSNLPSLVGVVLMEETPVNIKMATTWTEVLKNKNELKFTSVDFSDPVYILYSSGTTGVPKCIVHGVGGVLLQHFKELALHTNLSAGDKLLYFTTTGWMMWNWMASALMLGTSVVLYEGSPSHPDLKKLWSVLESEGVTVFGTSAKFISSCRNQNVDLSSFHFSQLQTILSTGSPLQPEDYDWIYAHIKKDLWLASISGGTDIVSCFFLGSPLLPVYRGELQCRGLGMAVEIYSDDAKPLIDQTGELVCTKPAPSMPIYFWNDPGHQKYREAYFDHFENVWRHGDYAKINERGGAVIYGRSDATLNPGGVRIGTAEIYRQVEQIDFIEDSLVVGLPHAGDVKIILFVIMKNNRTLDETSEAIIKQSIRINTTPRHVPHKIIQIQEVPYTLSGKKVELSVTKLLQGQKPNNLEALKNPQALLAFERLKNRNVTG